MTGDKPRSPLAEKAMALKSKRDAEEATEAERAQAAAARKETATARWGEIGREIVAVVTAVNDELAGTDTQVELTWDYPQANTQRSRLERKTRPRSSMMSAIRGEIQSTAILTLTLGGKPAELGKMTLAGYTRGDARVHDSATGESAQFDLLEMDRAWLDRKVRAFVDAALTPED